MHVRGLVVRVELAVGAGLEDLVPEVALAELLAVVGGNDVRLDGDLLSDGCKCSHNSCLLARHQCCDDETRTTREQNGKQG